MRNADSLRRFGTRNPQLFGVLDLIWSLRDHFTVRIPLLSAWRVVLFATVLLSAAGVLGLLTARAGLAAWALDHPDSGVPTRMLGLDLANAKLHHRVGSFALWSVEEGAGERARASLDRAAALAPYDPAIWADLARACDRLGDEAGAGRALEQALLLDPMAPRVQWLAAIFYARTGDTERAFSHSRRLLEQDPAYAPMVFNLSSRTIGDLSLLDAHFMPNTNQPQLRLALLRYLTEEGRLDLARKTWDAIAAIGRPFPFALAQPYVDRLISAGDAAEAARVWGDLCRLDVVPATAAQPGNAVFNGDFEHPPLGGGLDWRWFPQRDVWLDFADRGGYSGARCLHVDFVGERNRDYESVAQFVPVLASQSYRLSAWARSQAITSDSGPRLRLADPGCSPCPVVETASLVGTSPWHRWEAEFTTGPAQQFARISLVRPRSRTFPTEISGHFWLDDVRLQPTTGR